VFFDESNLRFIIIAISTARNILTAVGDLALRLDSVDADYWNRLELMELIERGERLLNIQFPSSCKEEIVKLSEGSVSIVQDVCYQLCQKEQVRRPEKSLKSVGQTNQVGPIVDEVVERLSHHYKSFLGAFAQGHQITELEMYKWILFAVLSAKMEELKIGLRFDWILEVITREHPRGRELSNSNLRSALRKVNELQWKRNIKPYVVYYDEAGTMLHIVDKSYYIWRRHQETDELFQHIGLNAQRALPRRKKGTGAQLHPLFAM
jgi:hypothetical protein